MKEDIFYEGELINKAGIDRTVLNHVELVKFNWPVFKDALNTSTNIVFEDGKDDKRSFYETKTGDKFHYLAIEDSDIGRLAFGANPLRFGIIEFSPANLREGVNLINFSAEEMQMFLYYVENLLYERYGIEVILLNCPFKEIELNTTFALLHPFNDYYRALTVMFNSTPYLTKDCEYNGVKNNKRDLQSCSSFNKSISVTAYNKGLELAVNLKQKGKILITDEDGVIIEADLMRIEFKLKNAETCKKWIKGMSTVGDLKDEMINEAFAGLILYYFLSPLEKWNARNKHFLRCNVKKYIKYGKKGHRWKEKLLTNLRNEELKNREVKLLDKEDLNAVIDEFKDKSGHKGRLKLKADFSGFACDDVFLRNDRKKLDEIVESLSYSVPLKLLKKLK